MKSQLNYLNAEFKGGLMWLVMGLYLVSLMAVSPLISGWMWGLLAAIGVWFVAEKRVTSLHRFNFVVMLLAVIGYVAAVLFLESNWLSAKAITGFLAVVVLLKLVEIQRRSEVLAIIAALMVLIGIGTLYWNSLVGFGLMLLVLFGVVFTMVLLSQVGKINWQADVKIAGKMFAMALPLALILFFFMPRFSGPLWDLGIAFGVPITLTQSAAPEPLIEGNRLRSDQFGSFMQQANTVLVAEFDGKVPYKSEMYWRGPVFTHFDGLEWYLPDNAMERSELMRDRYRTKAQWKQAVEYKGNPVKYSARVMPHGQRWLYALETSTAGYPETFLSRDFQLLSIRAIASEFNYEAFYLNQYRIKPKLDEQTRLDALAFPQGTHPGLMQFGKQLAIDFEDEEERVLELYRMFRQSFSKTTRQDAVKDNYLDEIWLKHKSGSLLDIASATTLVLRASGIPTRLVTGFRGGNIVALTDFVMVKQSHAHIWVEAWIENKGWVRVEPQDYIMVQRLNQAKSSIVSAKELGEPKRQKASSQTSKTDGQNANSSSVNQIERTKSHADDSVSQLQGGSEEKWWNVFDQWLVEYDADKQEKLLEKVGSSDSGSILKLFFIVLMVFVLLVPLYFLILGVWSRPKADKVAQAYKKLQLRLNKLVVPLENECPSVYLKRLQKANLETAEVVAPVLNQYLDYKYSGTPSSDKVMLQQFDRLLGLLS